MLQCRLRFVSQHECWEKKPAWFCTSRWNWMRCWHTDPCLDVWKGSQGSHLSWKKSQNITTTLQKPHLLLKTFSDFILTFSLFSADRRWGVCELPELHFTQICWSACCYSSPQDIADSCDGFWNEGFKAFSLSQFSWHHLLGPLLALSECYHFAYLLTRALTLFCRFSLFEIHFHSGHLKWMHLFSLPGC